MGYNVRHRPCNVLLLLLSGYLLCNADMSVHAMVLQSGLSVVIWGKMITNKLTKLLQNYIIEPLVKHIVSSYHLQNDNFTGESKYVLYF